MKFKTPLDPGTYERMEDNDIIELQSMVSRTPEYVVVPIYLIMDEDDEVDVPSFLRW